MERLRLEGNALFSSDPRAAAALYQEAICLYETLGSRSDALDEFTKCAGNAMTCLFKLREHEACIALAHKALRVNPLLAKAYAFIGRCIQQQQQQQEEQPNVAQSRRENPMQYLCRAVHLLPSMTESLLPFISDAMDRMLQERRANAEGEDEEPVIEVRQSDCGKCVVAASRLPPLMGISSVLNPFSVCAYAETGGRGVCAHCGTVTLHEDVTSLHVCVSCRLVAYCSETCATSHMLQHEQYECRLLVRLQEMQDAIHSRNVEAPDDFFTVAAHCIATRSSMMAHKAGYGAVLQLQSHAAEVSQLCGELVCLVQALLEAEDPALVTQLVGIVRCNALEVCDASGLGVGQALHVGNITSYFNHSCSPNCAIDRDMILTTRPIAPGDELTIAYLPQLYWPAQLRREELARRYFFDCRCPRCRVDVGGNGDPFEAALTATLLPDCERPQQETKHIAAVEQLCSRIREKDVGDIGPKDRDALLDLMQRCRQHLFPSHFACHELRNTLSFVYAVLGDTVACLHSCLEELLLWEAIVPGAHPVKRLKLLNALRCHEGGSGGDTSTPPPPLLLLLPLLPKFAALYDINC